MTFTRSVIFFRHFAGTSQCSTRTLSSERLCRHEEGPNRAQRQDCGTEERGKPRQHRHCELQPLPDQGRQRRTGLLSYL
jgi:hypothetical protein